MPKRGREAAGRPGGGGAGGGGPSAVTSKKMGKGNRHKSKKAKGKTFQVVRDSGVQGASRSGGSGDDSEDDFEAIRKANAAAIRQREHQQRVVAEQRAKIAEANEKQAAKKGPAREPATKEPTRKGSDPAVGKGKTPAAKATAKGQTKGKRKAPPPEESDDMASGSDSDSDSDEEEEGLDMTRKADPADDDFDEDSGSDVDQVDVTFDNFDPTEADFHGIKMFMTNLLDGQNFDSSGLVDIILAQAGTVGTVVKIMDEDEVYGLISIANMQSASSQASLRQIGDFILRKCPPRARDAFTLAVRGKTGLIINERMINVPPELAVPLLDSLLSEIKKAQRDPKTRDQYAFDSYLVLTQLLRDSAAPDSTAGSMKKKKKRQQEAGGGGGHGGRGDGGAAGEAITWLKAEDEVFAKHAFAHFEFALGREPEEGFHFFGRAMLVKASDIDKVAREVVELIGDEALRNQVRN